MRTANGGSRPDNGPHPGILALVSFALLVAGLAIAGAMSGGDALASPFTSSATVAERIREHHAAFRVAAFFQIGSAIPLAICSAAIYARQVRLGIRVPGPVIALSGGLLATMSLFVSAFATFVQSRPETGKDVELAHALAYFAFAAGGPGYVMGLGLLFAGIAVPALIVRLFPRWLAVIGLVIAALCELSWFSVLALPLQYLLPIGRFAGGIWLIAAGFLLPRTRPRRAMP